MKQPRFTDVSMLQSISGNANDQDIVLGTTDNFNVIIKADNFPYVTVATDGIVRIGDQTIDTTGQLAVGREQGGYLASGNHRAQFVATGTQTPIVAIGGSGSIEIWKDGTPTKASAFGGTVPGNPISDDFVFSKWNGSSWAETMRILNTNGNVGIGTTAPAEKLTVLGNISASGTITVLNGNSNRWNSNWTTTNGNSAAWSNWQSVSANYALGSQYVKLSGDNMTGLLTNNTGISSFSLSARFIDLVHLPANDGTNPVFRFGEYDTTSGNTGFSGMYMSYDETTNAFGISAQFAPTVLPAISINRNSVVGARTFVAGPAFNSFSTTTPISAVSGLYVDPVSGYTGFYTNVPIAPVDVRGTMKLAASAALIATSNGGNFKIQGNYGYYLANSSNALQVLDLTQTTALSTASAATNTGPRGLYVNGKYAYVATANGTSSVLQIFDVSQIIPVLVSTTTYGVGNFNAVDIYVQGNYAYTSHSAIGSPAAGRISIVDISNASYPKLVTNISSVGHNGRNLLAQGNYLYYLTNTFGGVVIYKLDISDPVNKTGTPVNIWNTSGTLYTFAIRGNYLYVEYNAIFGIFDLSKPNNTLVGSFTLPTIPASWFGETIVQGNYVYVTRLSNLYKVDITTLSSPVLVQNMGGIAGVSGEFNPLQIQGRYAYVLDYSSPTRIRTIDLGGAYVQQLQAGGIKTDRLHVIHNTILGNDLDVFGGAAFGQGFKSYKDSSVQGSLTVTTSLSSTSASNLFTVTSGANASTLFLIASTGNVGIGTAVPGSRLTVVGDISASNVIYANNVSTSIVDTASSSAILYALPTTLNLGGAATTLNLGATTGTTTINNNLSMGSGKTISTTGTITSDNAVAFSAGAGAISNVALAMPRESALRNSYNGDNAMYFDVSNGGSTHGSFSFRSTNSFTSLLVLKYSGTTFNVDMPITGQSPTISKTAFNAALDTEITAGNFRFRITNSGGIFPQVIGNGGAVNAAWTCIAALNGTAIAQAGSTGTIVSSSVWSTLYNLHGMDAAGDTINCTIQDKAAGRIYRVTFMRSDNGSTTGYNIISERIL